MTSGSMHFHPLANLSGQRQPMRRFSLAGWFTIAPKHHAPVAVVRVISKAAIYATNVHYKSDATGTNPEVTHGDEEEVGKEGE